MARLPLSPLALLSLPVAALSGCAPGQDPFASDDATTGDEAYLKNVEKTGGASQKWIYQGTLPKLDAAKVFVSLKGHTVRITGLLPAGYSEQLPFYAVPKALENGRTELTVVYPVATGKVDPSTGQAPMGPGLYPRLFGVPFTPTTDKAEWGGFPFIKYHQKRGLAFHGPITSSRNADTGDWEWVLKRGPVSHGCQRMMGEHVVEFAHLLGMDMDEPHKASDRATIEIQTLVSTEYDSFDGQLVDVDYPVTAGAVRPQGGRIFPTWDSRNLPQLVCAYDPSKPLDGTHCDGVGLVKQDVVTGEMLVTEEDEGVLWIGSVCDADADCAFAVDGVPARCATSNGGGYCTVACEGYCADKEGAAGTFCGRTQSGGTCMAKAAEENAGCAEIDGTTAKQVERFVGSSGAPAKVATVCSF
jgi:hypothetical protein